MTLNIKCSWRSFTTILSPDECCFNMAYFPIVDIFVMATLTTGECCVLLLPSSHINVTLENLLSGPKSQIQNVSVFLLYTISTTNVNVVVRVRREHRSLYGPLEQPVIQKQE